MTDYLLLMIVGTCSGIGGAIGQVIVKLWLEPHLTKIHQHSLKVKEIIKIR
jgi:hypothetical protein